MCRLPLPLYVFVCIPVLTFVALVMLPYYCVTYFRRLRDVGRLLNNARPFTTIKLRSMFFSLERRERIIDGCISYHRWLSDTFVVLNQDALDGSLLVLFLPVPNPANLATPFALVYVPRASWMHVDSDVRLDHDVVIEHESEFNSFVENSTSSIAAAALIFSGRVGALPILSPACPRGRHIQHVGDIVRTFDTGIAPVDAALAFGASARRIQRNWRRAIGDPGMRFCRERLRTEFTTLLAEAVVE